jgi:hypothetical protein
VSELGHRRREDTPASAARPAACGMEASARRRRMIIKG